jgi:hypothetical protein
MFNLEQSIAGWRKQMLAAGIKTPALLEELESHLREEFERQTKMSLDGREAFDFAVQKIGRARVLKREFTKIVLPLETRFVKLASIACGFTAGAFLLWITYNLLVIHEANLAERIMGFTAVALAILTWRYGGRLLPAIPHLRLRTAMGLLSCLASVGGIMLFINSVPHLLNVPAGTDLPVGRLLMVFVWVWTAAVMLAAIAYRLEDAAHKNNEQYV